MVFVEFDPNEIYDNIQKSTDVSLSSIAEQIKMDTEPYVPMKTGKLRASADIPEKTKESILISYSRYLNGDDIAEDVYKGINPIKQTPIYKWTTPGTGPYWVDKSIAINEESWIRIFRQLTKDIWNERSRRKRAAAKAKKG